MDLAGFTYIPNFITIEEENQLFNEISNKPWNTSLKRLTQHYGFVYDYSNPKLNEAETIPDFIMPIKTRIENQLNQTFDMVIVNRYLPGEGISPHTDHVKLFDDTIVSLSLESECVMVFSRDRQNPKEVTLERRSIVILQEDARYKWRHSIPARKVDNGKKRDIRISITFRRRKQ